MKKKGEGKRVGNKAYPLAQRLVRLILGADGDEGIVLVLPRRVLRRLEVQLVMRGANGLVRRSWAEMSQLTPAPTLNSFMSPRPSDSCKPVFGSGRGAALRSSASGRLGERGQRDRDAERRVGIQRLTSSRRQSRSRWPCPSRGSKT
jgi:hypothetical protein